MVPKVCSIDGCGEPHEARGWCNKHYIRWRNHGDPEPATRVNYRDPEDAFKARTEWQYGCLVWVGSTSTGGYGRIRVAGREVNAHRYAWERANGPIPDGLDVDHVCRNRLCCNVSHLRLATRKQNMEHVGVSAKNTSGYRGVSWEKGTKKWASYVNHNRTKINLGYFHSKEEAADAAKAKRLELFTHNNLDRMA